MTSFLQLKAPFVELRTLLTETEPPPPQAEIINLAVGEPQHAQPTFVADALAEAVAAGGLGKYPATKGSDSLRQAQADWVKRRFGVELDRDKHILPVCGTREALFLIGLLASHRKTGHRKTGHRKEVSAKKKIVFVPDPGYQCYAAAAFGAGCEVVFLNADKENNFLPDLTFVEQEIKTKYQNDVCAFYLCSPANPQGQVADKNYLAEAVRLARAWDFILITDECYTELYDNTPPPSVLEVAHENNFRNVISFHSLSKRSNLPGLRSGFCAGCETLIQNFRIMRELGGVAMPQPTQEASAQVWADDAHVANNRALYKEKFDLAESYFDSFQGFYRPQGGFFLWFCLDEFNISAVEMTKKLWHKAAISVLPGNFLSQQNRGDNYIRIALVVGQEKLDEAFKRMRKIFQDSAKESSQENFND